MSERNVEDLEKLFKKIAKEGSGDGGEETAEEVTENGGKKSGDGGEEAAKKVAEQSRREALRAAGTTNILDASSEYQVELMREALKRSREKEKTGEGGEGSKDDK